MLREEIIHFVKSLNSSLDIEFLESLSKVELQGYVEHLKAVRQKTKDAAKLETVKAALK